MLRTSRIQAMNWRRKYNSIGVYICSLSSIPTSFPPKPGGINIIDYNTNNHEISNANANANANVNANNNVNPVGKRLTKVHTLLLDPTIKHAAFATAKDAKITSSDIREKFLESFQFPSHLITKEIFRCLIRYRASIKVPDLVFLLLASQNHNYTPPTLLLTAIGTMMSTTPGKLESKHVDQLLHYFTTLKQLNSQKKLFVEGCCRLIVDCKRVNQPLDGPRIGLWIQAIGHLKYRIFDPVTLTEAFSHHLKDTLVDYEKYATTHPLIDFAPIARAFSKSKPPCWEFDVEPVTRGIFSLMPYYDFSKLSGHDIALFLPYIFTMSNPRTAAPIHKILVDLLPVLYQQAKEFHSLPESSAVSFLTSTEITNILARIRFIHAESLTITNLLGFVADEMSLGAVQSIIDTSSLYTSSSESTSPSSSSSSDSSSSTTAASTTALSSLAAQARILELKYSAYSLPTLCSSLFGLQNLFIDSANVPLLLHCHALEFSNYLLYDSITETFELKPGVKDFFFYTMVQMSIGAAFFGLKNMTNTSSSMKFLLKTLTPFLRESPDRFNSRTLSSCFQGISSMTSDTPEVNEIVQIIADRLAKSEPLTPKATVYFLSSLKYKSLNSPAVVSLIDILIKKIGQSNVKKYDFEPLEIAHMVIGLRGLDLRHPMTKYLHRLLSGWILQLFKNSNNRVSSKEFSDLLFTGISVHTVVEELWLKYLLKQIDYHSKASNKGNNNSSSSSSTSTPSSSTPSSGYLFNNPEAVRCISRITGADCTNHDVRKFIHYLSVSIFQSPEVVFDTADATKCYVALQQLDRSFPCVSRLYEVVDAKTVFDFHVPLNDDEEEEYRPRAREEDMYHFNHNVNRYESSQELDTEEEGEGEGEGEGEEDDEGEERLEVMEEEEEREEDRWFK